MSRLDASSAAPPQKSASTTAPTTRPVSSTAAPLAIHNRSRRGTNSSWLLIDPVFQSWPAYVVPMSISRPVRMVMAAAPTSVRSVVRSSSLR